MEQYSILGRIGEGAHGIVFKAKHIEVNTDDWMGLISDRFLISDQCLIDRRDGGPEESGPEEAGGWDSQPGPEGDQGPAGDRGQPACEFQDCPVQRSKVTAARLHLLLLLLFFLLRLFRW